MPKRTVDVFELAIQFGRSGLDEKIGQLRLRDRGLARQKVRSVKLLIGGNTEDDEPNKNEKRSNGAVPIRPESLIAGFIGACILIAIARAFSRRAPV
jgi:hypothetical protein